MRYATRSRARTRRQVRPIANDRFFVTGTDTDVGKTRVVAALARALVNRGERPTIVKLAQTGCGPTDVGDAERAADRAGCAGAELARFALPADPWSAALAADAEPLRAADLAHRLEAFAGPLVVEGAGGAAVPLNADEDLADVAVFAGCAAVVAIGLRIGCISHARMTLDYLARRNVRVLGAVFVDRWATTTPAYRADVRRALPHDVPIVDTLEHVSDEASAIAADAQAIDSFLERSDADRTPMTAGRVRDG